MKIKTLPDGWILPSIRRRLLRSILELFRINPLGINPLGINPQVYRTFEKFSRYLICNDFAVGRSNHNLNPTDRR